MKLLSLEVFRLLSSVCVAGMLLTSCEIDRIDNGDLDGFWQFVRIDTLKTGNMTDVHESGIYWAVQRRLLEIQNTKDLEKSVFFRFDHSTDSLHIGSPFYDIRKEGDPQVTDPLDLEDYGLTALEEHFKVERLDDKGMTLRSLRYRLYFRKH